MKSIIFTMIFFYGQYIYSIAFNNAHILQTDSIFSHHVIVVEKSTHRLFLFKNNDRKPELIKTYDIATGKSRGDKQIQGDRKTPEGIYFTYNFISQKNLLKKYGNYGKIYGIGAFPLDYPNVYDKLNRKTGGGIWIHSTDDDRRVGKKLDSKGCVVLKRQDLYSLAKYLDIDRKTPVIIVEKVYFQDALAYQTEKTGITNFINSWQKSWKAQNLYSYIAHYDSVKYRDSVRGSFPNFVKYKRNIFAQRTKPSIHFSHHSIMLNHDYAVVRMLQNYRARNLVDTGVKTLYLKKDHRYNWKIVAETWEKAPGQLSNFTPKQRYFR